MKKLPTVIASDPLTPGGSLSISVDMTALRHLSMRELAAFQQGLRLTSEILSAIRCQPRSFTHGAPHKGADILEDITEWLHTYEQAAVNVAQAAVPSCAREAEHRAWLLVGFNADMRDNLAEHASITDDAARGVAKAKRKELRGAA